MTSFKAVDEISSSELVTQKLALGVHPHCQFKLILYIGRVKTPATKEMNKYFPMSFFQTIP